MVKLKIKLRNQIKNKIKNQLRVTKQHAIKPTPEFTHFQYHRLGFSIELEMNILIGFLQPQSGMSYAVEFATDDDDITRFVVYSSLQQMNKFRS
jgi:hypothetical protein